MSNRDRDDIFSAALATLDGLAECQGLFETEAETWGGWKVSEIRQRLDEAPDDQRLAEYHEIFHMMATSPPGPGDERAAQIEADEDIYEAGSEAPTPTSRSHQILSFYEFLHANVFIPLAKSGKVSGDGLIKIFEAYRHDIEGHREE